MDTANVSDITTGTGTGIAIDGTRYWITTPSGGRLFFLRHSWISTDGPPVLGDRVSYRQIRADFKSVKRVSK